MTYFTFSRALHLMKNSGAKVRRAEWGRDAYIEIIMDSFYETYSERKHLVSNIRCADILANDWEIYNDR